MSAEHKHRMRWIKLYSHLLFVTSTPPWHWLWTHAHGHRSTHYYSYHLPTSMSGSVWTADLMYLSLLHRRGAITLT
eukprot:5062159-Prymnesium_polylepis.1